MLHHGEDVCEHLRGVPVHSHPVEHGHIGVLDELVHHRAIHAAHDDGVRHAADDLGCVAHGLVPLADLEVLHREELGVPAKLRHGGFERDAGSGGVDLEDHRKDLVLEEREPHPLLLGILQEPHEVQQILNLASAEVCGRVEVVVGFEVWSKAHLLVLSRLTTPNFVRGQFVRTRVLRHEIYYKLILSLDNIKPREVEKSR